MKYVYWDSCCFISLLSKEPTYLPLESIMKRAETNELVIVTSSITMVEVNHAGSSKSLAIEDLRKVGAAFDALNNVMLVDLTPTIAESARELIWKHDLKNYDAVHLATALSVKSGLPVSELHTFDKHLLKLNVSIGEFNIFQPTLTEYPLPQEEISGFSDQ